MAKDIANPRVWQLNFQEVEGELLLKMAEVVDQYQGKPFEELKALVIKSLQNHKTTLTRRCYGTHRALEIGSADIDDDRTDEKISSGEVSGFIVDDFLRSLPTDDGRLLVREMLKPGARTRWFMNLAMVRKEVTSMNGGWQMTPTPLLMERALGWDAPRLKIAWNEVADAFALYTADS
jgi:hypothetical protein